MSTSDSPDHLLGSIPPASLYDHLPVGVVVTDLHRRILYANRRVAEWNGYSVGELIGESMDLLVSPNERALNTTTILGAMAGPGRWHGYLHGRRADGRLVRFEVTAHRTRLPEVDEDVIVEVVRPVQAEPPADAALLEAERRYHALLADIPEAVIVFDADTLCILEVNDTTVQRYGWSRDEWLRMSVLDIRPSQEIDRAIRSIYETSTDRLSYDHHFTHRRRDGTVFPVDIYSRLHRLGGRNVIVAVVVDITEQLQGEQRRQASERIYRSIVENSPFGIGGLRLREDGEWVIELVNPVGIVILARAQHEYVGRPLGEVYPAMVRHGVPELCTEALRTGRTVQAEQFEYADERVRGVYHLRVFPISPSQVIVIFEDLGQRRAAEEALRASERRYRTLVESSGDMICTLDADLRFTSVNSVMERKFGWPEERYLGRHPVELGGGAAAITTGLAAVAECARTRRPLVVELSVPVSGRTTHINITVAPLLDDNGRISQYIFTMREVTELREMERQLAQAQRLDSLGRLAGGVAHDFNNLLACIQGNLDLVLTGTAGPDLHRECLHDARQASLRAAELVRQILTFSRQTPVRLESLDLRRTVQEAMTILRGTLSSRIRMEFETIGEVRPVRVDPAQATQVVMNLCLNARDAMPDGGALLLRLEGVDRPADAPQDHPEARPGRFVRLSVIDDGSGIAPEVIDRVFEPFFTTKAVGAGTGLGLAVAYGIVSRAGGWISVASRVGKGSRFDVYLPVDTAEGGGPA